MEGFSGKCPVLDSRNNKYSREIIDRAIRQIENGQKKKLNAVWLETSGCFGEIISFLNTEDPDIIYVLRKMLNITFLGSLSGDQGEEAFKQLLDTLNTEYIFIVCGAIPTRSNGLFTRIAEYNGKVYTAAEVVTMVAAKAKYIIALGTCACYGGPTAARPNISFAESIRDYLNRTDIIQLPGCPTNPVWTASIIGYLISSGVPKLDSDGRPIDFYGETIHRVCPRRSYFDNGVFATKLGEPECMFKLGCRGPITKVSCPKTRWNSSDNWPIGDNTTCIGCAGPGFPDKTAPYVVYGGE